MIAWSCFSPRDPGCTFCAGPTSIGNSVAVSAGFSGCVGFLRVTSVFTESCQVGLFSSYSLQRRACIWALPNAAHAGNEAQIRARLLLVQCLAGSSAGLFLVYSGWQTSTGSVTQDLSLVISLLSIWLSPTYPIIFQIFFSPLLTLFYGHRILYQNCLSVGAPIAPELLVEVPDAVWQVAVASQSQQASSKELRLNMTFLIRHCSKNSDLVWCFHRTWLQ